MPIDNLQNTTAHQHPPIDPILLGTLLTHRETFGHKPQLPPLYFDRSLT